MIFMPITTHDLVDFFLNETPRFDEAITEDIRPRTGWLLNVQSGTTPVEAKAVRIPKWWSVREMVRKLSEADCFHASEFTPKPKPTSEDRFRDIFPDTKKAWQSVVKRLDDEVGEPCDPPEVDPRLPAYYQR